MSESILGLKLPTDPRWANAAEKSLEFVLTDHAFCEQKATSTCISLIQKYPERTELVKQLIPVVAEEWSHFKAVYDEIQKRGFELGDQRKDEYVNELLKFTKKDGSRDDKLVEKLLICALIEARSCERFRILSENLEDEYFRKFYRHFMESEAGHYTMFIKLAELYGEKVKVRKRWQEILEFEAELLQRLKSDGTLIH